MTTLVTAVLSSLGFGTANIVIKKSLQSISIPTTLFMSSLSGLLTLAIFWLIASVFGIWEWNLLFNLETVIALMILSAMEITLYILLYKAFSSADLTIANTILTLYPVVITVFSVVFLGTESTADLWIFIFLMIIGALIVSIDWQGVVRDGLDKSDVTKGIFWVIIAMLAHAIYFPLLASYTADGGLLEKLLLIKIFSSVIVFLGSRLIFKKFPLPKRAKVISLSFLGILEMVGWVGYAAAIAGDVSQVGFVTAALNMSSIVTAVLAYLVLKEKLKPLQYLGIIIIIGGVIWQSIQA